MAATVGPRGLPRGLRGLPGLFALMLAVLVPAARGGHPPWEVDDNTVCGGAWSCLRRDLAVELSDILTADQYNVTPTLAVERLDLADDAHLDDGGRDRMATSLNEAGMPTLAATAIKLFETHALVWKLWPGFLHMKIFRNPGEGMDAAVEIPPNTDGRTWGAIGARRRITMALLPIMYKMGVGTTLLGVLTFIALKTMFMVSILFVLAVSSFFKHKLGALSAHHYGGGVAYIPVAAPPPHHHAAPHKEVHVHFHADPHKQAYSGWHRYGSHAGPSVPAVEHGHGHGHHHPIYASSAYHPSLHSAGGEDGYYESEPPPSASSPPYYHRRFGVVGVPVGPSSTTTGGMMAVPVSVPLAGGHAAHAAHAQQLHSRWDPVAGAAEPAYYTGTYTSRRRR